MNNRREFLKLLGASTALGSTTAASLGAQAARPSPARPGKSGLSARGEYIIRDAYVLTMDRALGDIPGSGVHVKNGTIAAAGNELQSLGAHLINRSRTM